MALTRRDMQSCATIIVAKVDIGIGLSDVGDDSWEGANGAELEECAPHGEFFGRGGEVGLGGEVAVASFGEGVGGV